MINVDVDPNAKLKINGKDFKIADFQKPFLPGSYELQATREYPWTSMIETQTVIIGNEPKTDVTATLMYDADGNPYMVLEGVVQFHRLKTDYICEKEIVKDMSIKVLYAEDQEMEGESIKRKIYCSFRS